MNVNNGAIMAKAMIQMLSMLILAVTLLPAAALDFTNNENVLVFDANGLISKSYHVGDYTMRPIYIMRITVQDLHQYLMVHRQNLMYSLLVKGGSQITLVSFTHR